MLTLTVLGYPIILIGIGIWRSRSITNHADFMVAGRTLPAWVLVGSLVCTWVGAGTLFGGAGLAYRSGISALWFSIGAWLGLVAVYFMAPRVRRLAQYTVPDILERRYNPTARILGTIAIMLAYIAIAAYQFRGGGWILSIATDGALCLNKVCTSRHLSLCALRPSQEWSQSSPSMLLMESLLHSL